MNLTFLSGVPFGSPTSICGFVCVSVCYPNLFWSQLSHFKSDLNRIKSKVCLLSQYISTSQKARSDQGDNYPCDNCPRRQLTISSQFKSDLNGIKSKVCLLTQYNSTSQKARSDQGDNCPSDNCPRRQLSINSHFKSDLNGIKDKVCLLSQYNLTSQEARSEQGDNYPGYNCPRRQVTIISNPNNGLLSFATIIGTPPTSHSRDFYIFAQYLRNICNICTIFVQYLYNI